MSIITHEHRATDYLSMQMLLTIAAGIASLEVEYSVKAFSEAEGLGLAIAIATKTNTNVKLN